MPSTMSASKAIGGSKFRATRLTPFPGSNRLRPAGSGSIFRSRPMASLASGCRSANAEFPLLESDIDVVVEGALDYGENFARELLETTSDWSNYWLNDRELARRPWVYNPASSQVDELLMETSRPPRI